MPWPGRMLSGAMLLGWGIFNLVEGIIDHYILGLHHVIERFGLTFWDHAFVGSGALLIGLGLGMIKGDRRDSFPSGAASAHA